MAITIHRSLDSYLSSIVLPSPQSRKGENGKLLIIGGSDLFHAAGAWSLEAAARVVDMVFYSSVPSNNELIEDAFREAKREFWSGIVVPREDLESYLQECDAILIGPGMDRSLATQELVDRLVSNHLDKRWVIDAGALQMISFDLLKKLKNAVITPHAGEFERVFGQPASELAVKEVGAHLSQLVILLKGPRDVIVHGEQIEIVSGGNAGMTKGGTGDVLAGVLAGLFTKSPAFSSAVVASIVNKQAGERLEESRGVFFNATDLVSVVGEELKRVVSQS